MPGRFNLADYVPVQERINAFWQDHPNGRIITRLASDTADWTQCRYQAAVYTDRDDAHPVATGYAFEKAGGGGANSTSHEENCETSAIGRALANLGYATSNADRPSQQEMSKASRASEPPVVPATHAKPQTGTSAPAVPGNGNGAVLSNDEQVRVVELREAIKAANNGRELKLLGDGIKGDTTLTDAVRAAIRPAFVARQREVQS